MPDPAKPTWLDDDHSHAAWAPPSAKRKRDEFALQRDVVQFLRLTLPADACVISIPNEGRRSRKAGGELKQTGMLPGAPDLLVVWRGRALFIELKTPDGALSKAQRLAHRALDAAGADVCVCRSLDDVASALAQAGVRLRAQLL